LEFDEHIFSLIFLPIIIFQSGYSLSLSHFFKRLGKILTFAFIGTIITTVFIGTCLYGLSEAGVIGAHKFTLAESFAFASLISAIDPVATLCTFGSLGVEPTLAITVMGESVINDAVSLALYRTFSEFVVNGYHGTEDAMKQIWNFVVLLCLSTFLGLVIGLVSALQIKIVSQRMGMNCQIIVMTLWSYVAYASAEAAGVSGIIASVVCGIVMNHFCKKNFNGEQKDYINRVFVLFASFCDMAIFFMAGMSIAFNVRLNDYSLLAWVIVLCLVGRALNVFPLSFLLNLNDPDDKITPKEQAVMWHAGLRGAIAFSIALQFPDETGLRHTVIDVTSLVILLSVFGLGGTTSRMLEVCQIARNVQDNHENHEKAVKAAVDRSWLKAKMRYIDRQILQPIFVKKKMRTYSVTGSVDDPAQYDHFAVEARESLAAGSYVRGGGGGVSLLHPEDSLHSRPGTESGGRNSTMV
jgi:sodium/hydrogen exchanger 8